MMLACSPAPPVYYSNPRHLANVPSWQEAGASQYHNPIRSSGWHYGGTGSKRNRVPRLFEGRDHRRFSPGFEEGDSSLHLRLHAAGCELALLQVGDALVFGQPRERPRGRLAIVQKDILDVGEYQEHLRTHSSREKRGAKVLVNHSFDA